MGSVIGDYIHLNVSNYLQYGTSRTGIPSKTSITQVYTAQRSKNLERINSLPSIDYSVLNELEERIKKSLPEGKDGAKENAAARLAEQKLSDEFKNKLLSEVGIASMQKIGISSSAIQEMETNNSKVNIEEAKRAKRRVEENIDRIKKQWDKHEAVNQNTLNTLIKNFQQYFETLGTCLPQGYVLNSKDIQDFDIFTAIKSVVREVSFVDAHKATINGAWGEQTVALCGDVATSKAYEAVNGVIVGSKVSSFKLNESVIPKVVGKQFKQDTGINLYQSHASQDKVDVQIVVNKQPLNVSVKAYSSKGNTINAHLQDVSLLTSLATTEGDFANHWLNLHSLTGSAFISGSGDLDRALEDHIKYEALVSGNLLKQGAQKADTFVTIDTVQGRVYAVSTKDILKNSSNFYLRPSINSIHIGGNKRASSWAQRISNILQNVHSKKISVILNVKLKS